MPDKPFDWWPLLKQVATYGWVMGLSMLGGAVSHLQRINALRLRFRWLAFAAELLTSGFVGLLTYWLCQAAAMSAPMTAVMVGIAGHMGTRSLFRLEKLYGRLFGENP
ncbi:phage holin family protein [Leeia aquatica]|uniref:Holin n=1 Tax=Leeia aquatica TaxID=2725557 RepID=A0A847SAU9_9NEIS|nr:phage holin family protein [Leeia aquatica]NLR74208.1 hypothetical protein [Leeia aquatica]